MRIFIENLLKRASWLPGLGFLDDWANSLNHKFGQFQQTKGDYQARYDIRKSMAKDMMGTKDDSEEGDEESVADKPAAGSKKAAAAGGTEPAAEPTASSGGYRRPRRRRSLAAVVAWLMFLFLVILLAVTWTLFLMDDRNVPWRHSMSWLRITLQVVLVVAIPVALHSALKYWTQGDSARYPDIDFAWRRGLEVLERCQVDLREAPIFLVLGCESHLQERSLVQSTDMDFSATDIPGGPAPLHWSIAPNGIFLFASGVGWTSALANREFREQLTTSGSLASATSDSISQLPPGGDNYVDAEQRRLASAEQLGKATASGSAGENRLSSMESAEQLDRLQYLCQLLQVHRHPACPINGLLVVVTKRFASESDAQLHERENAMASDLRLVQQSTQLRCPVTVLVTGMEQEAGFRELIRRVGIKRARQQRFGKRYEATMAKNDSVLSAFAVHVCGAFEDWIYALFREQDALSRPGNVGLYQLLCNVRCSMKPRLTRLLTHVFSETPATEPLLFSGCYFAATGDTTDKQGFVRAVFNKLIQEQDLLEWTQQAKKQDVRMRWIGLLGLGVLVGVAVGLIAMVGLQFVNPG